MTQVGFGHRVDVEDGGSRVESFIAICSKLGVLLMQCKTANPDQTLFLLFMEIHSAIRKPDEDTRSKLTRLSKDGEEQSMAFLDT